MTAINFFNELLGIVDKAASYRMTLKLLVLALVVDIVLVAFMGTSLTAVTWSELASHPGRVLIFFVGYRLLMSVGAIWLKKEFFELFEWPVEKVRSLISFSSDGGKSIGYPFVSESAAEEALSLESDELMRQRLDAHYLRRAKEKEEWDDTVTGSIMCLALLLVEGAMDGTFVHALLAWNALSLLALAFVAGLPAGYFLWSGYPGHDWFEWPDLAIALKKRKVSAYWRRASALDSDSSA